MTGAFNYRPKFKDIRIRPPKPEDAEAEDVNRLKPGERPCDWVDCRKPAQCKAPKSRERLNEHYWFCTDHASEYNRSWNFFGGMSDDEVRQYQEASQTGHRPTWAFRASRESREAAVAAARLGNGQGDAYGLFKGKRASKAAVVETPKRHLGRLERMALTDLDLHEDADGSAIRARYAELIKRYHPDANGGDRSAEHRLQKIIKAYRTLRAAKMA